MTVAALIGKLECASLDAQVWLHELDSHFGTPNMRPCRDVVFLDNGDVVLSYQPTLAREDAPKMSRKAERSSHGGQNPSENE